MATTEVSNRCSVRITDYINGWPHGDHQCSRRGTVEREGNLYCGQHDPVASKERSEAKYKEWRERSDRDMERRRLEQKAPDMLSLLQFFAPFIDGIAFQYENERDAEGPTTEAINYHNNREKLHEILNGSTVEVCRNLKAG